MVWPTASGEAARAALRDAAESGRRAAAAAPVLADGVQWRSPAFRAFRQRADEWCAEVVAFARALDGAVDAVPDACTAAFGASPVRVTTEWAP